MFNNDSQIFLSEGYLIKMSNKEFKLNFRDELAYALLDDLVPYYAKDEDSVVKKRLQILQGACMIFSEKGFHPTTTREIALACNISPGLMYHYVSSKDDMLYLAFKYIQADWNDHLSKPDVTEIKDPLEKLKKNFEKSIRWALENRDLLFLIYTESKYLNEKHLQAVKKIDSENVVGLFRNLLTELKQEKHSQEEIDELANLVAFQLAFYVLRGWNLKQKDVGKRTEFLMNFVVKGLGLDI